MSGMHKELVVAKISEICAIKKHCAVIKIGIMFEPKATSSLCIPPLDPNPVIVVVFIGVAVVVVIVVVVVVVVHNVSL